MKDLILKSKISLCTVTHSEPDYEGSCAIDGMLLDAAGINEHEQLYVYNADNGKDFVTYAIRAEDYSGVISVNGAAAHKADPGDRIDICTYGELNKDDYSESNTDTCFVLLTSDNTIKKLTNGIRETYLN